MLIATQPIDKNKKVKHFEKKLDSINQFHRKNREFIKYIKSQSTQFDELYFTRKEYNTREVFSGIVNIYPLLNTYSGTIRRSA